MNVRARWCTPGLVICCACPHGERRLEPPDGSAPRASDSAAEAGPAPATLPDDEWDGSYVSEAGSLYVVDGGEWANVKWRGDDASAGLGRGEVSITVRGAVGRVEGSASGAIGDVVWLGAVDGDTLTASILRKNPSDGGLTGTAVGKVSREQIVGTMRLSLADARVIREAKFTLNRHR
jgi:hypothetical protein